jgi:4-phosphopantoate--beta-alanine ligase
LLMNIPKTHPRRRALLEHGLLARLHARGVVATAGLIAHGRGEALDYLQGERTNAYAKRAIRAAAALLLLAERPVISVNGNAAALAARQIAELARSTGSSVEVNLFYRTKKREQAVAKALRRAGIKPLLPDGARIPELFSNRRSVNSNGICAADVVLVPLEDGDRTEALVAMGKAVIAIDLNPLSRTAQSATITIVDNITRAMPLLVAEARRLKRMQRARLERMTTHDNGKTLAEALLFMAERITTIAKKRA